MRSIWLCIVVTVWGAGPPLRAQPEPDPAQRSEPGSVSEPDPEPEPEPDSGALSAADEAALREALAADRAAAATEAGAPPAVSVPAASPVQSMNPDLSVIADFALAAFSDQDRQRQSGAHDPTRNGFNLQQLELAVGAAVDPYFRFDGNLVFFEQGVEIEEAYATTLQLPARLQLRAGQFLSRFGRFNASHLHAWDFADQPFPIGRIFGAEGGRGLGVELSWLSPLPWYVELVGSTQMAAGEATARSFYGASDQGVERLADLLYVVAVKQFFALSEDWSLAVGLSSAFGPNGTGRDNRSEVYGVDFYLKWRPIRRQSQQAVALHSEWFYRRRQVPGALLQDIDDFTQLSFRFAQRWAVAARHEHGSPTYDASFSRRPGDLDPEWTAHRHRVAVALTFFPTEFSRLRLQPSADVAGWQDEPLYAIFLALELAAGAHGAHTF